MACKPRSSPRLRLAAFLGALAAHLAVLYAIAHEMPDDSMAGGQGRLLDAVNITMVSSKVFEARQDADAPPAPVAAAAVEAKEGSVESEPAPQQPEQKVGKREPEKAPEVPPPPVQAVEAPAAVKAPHEEKSERREASTPADAGGAAARGDALLEEKQSAPAAASPGAVREYARYVIQALAKAKPKSGVCCGTVNVKLVISPDGQIASLEVLKSSGNGHLDDAALAAVRRARFPRPPPGMTYKQRWFEFPVNFVR